MYKTFLSLLFLLIALPAVAESERSWWKFWEDTGETVATTMENRLFTKDEKSILNEYLRNRALNKHGDEDIRNEYKGKKNKKQKPLPLGLQKKLERGGELPPGWQKKVARGEVLEGDLYLASRSIPRNIIDLLPSGPDGTSIRRIEDRVVRVMDATSVILDVLTGSQK
ncbi:MAG: hypothetical protein HRT93_07610 [Piscirickettsiaceae bacterium]|nr:hypothetical protein [Piscirickettsiaceae bacterium]